LRAALEWSYGLLTGGEQTLLRRLGVFAGGFTLEAAQHVAADDEGIDQWDVLEHLGALVDKSLVRADGEGTPRYRVLETTRLFTLERLIESGEAGDVRRRHLEHYVERSVEGIERIRIGHPLGLAFFDCERDNILLALEWAAGNDSTDAGLRLAAATRYYWSSRGIPARGVEVMRAALARSSSTEPSVARCHVLGTAAHLSSLTGDRAASRRDADQAVHEARLVGDMPCLCIALSGAGFACLVDGEIEHARDLAAEAILLARQIGDGHELGNAVALLAAIYNTAGERERAREAQEEAVALRQRLGHPWSEAVARINLAQMALEGDAPNDALPHLLEVFELLKRIDSEQIGVYLLEATASWCARVGLYETAVLVEATTASQYRRVGMVWRIDAVQASGFKRARGQLDSTTLERTQQLGSKLSYKDALQLAKECLLSEIPPRPAQPESSDTLS